MQFTFTGYLVFFVLLFFLSKTKTGYNLIYYGLIMILIYILVTSTSQLRKVTYKGGN